jgi:hypothetical protein
LLTTLIAVPGIVLFWVMIRRGFVDEVATSAAAKPQDG